jgi:hypothetical protein
MYMLPIKDIRVSKEIIIVETVVDIGELSTNALTLHTLIQKRE